MHITVKPSVTIEGTEQELADLASALLEAAVLGTVSEPVLLTDEGVASITVRRVDEDTHLPEQEP